MTQKIEINHPDRLPEINSYALNGMFMDPDGVLHDPTMNKDEKKGLLASWASDVRAVKDAPGLRQLDSGLTVEVDEIMRALRDLDKPTSASMQPKPSRPPYYARRPFLAKWRHKGRRVGPDDDGAPPSAPAAAMFPWPVPSAKTFSQPEWA